MSALLIIYGILRPVSLRLSKKYEIENEDEDEDDYCFQ